MGYGQTKACPAVLSRDRCVSLGKLLEQVLFLLRSDSNTGIGDTEADPFLAILRALVHIDGDGAVIREFARIAQEVKQDLPNLCDIGTHHANVVRHLDLDLVSVLSGSRLKSRDDFLDQTSNIEGLQVQAHLSSFNLRKIEHVIDQCE